MVNIKSKMASLERTLALSFQRCGIKTSLLVRQNSAGKSLTLKSHQLLKKLHIWEWKQIQQNRDHVSAASPTGVFNSFKMWIFPSSKRGTESGSNGQKHCTHTMMMHFLEQALVRMSLSKNKMENKPIQRRETRRRLHHSCYLSFHNDQMVSDTERDAGFPWCLSSVTVPPHQLGGSGSGWTTWTRKTYLCIFGLNDAIKYVSIFI